MVDKELLDGILFLRGLPDAVIENISAIAEVRTYEKDDFVFERNSELTHIYMVVSGKVHYTVETATRKVLIVDKITEKRTFGVFALMDDDSSSTYTAICAEKSTIVSISAAKMKKLFEQDFKIGHLLMLKVVKLLKKRIEMHTRQFLLSLATHSEISQMEESK